MNDTSTLFAIDGRKGIVFGAAGGIGAVLCDQIARHGAELALCDIREAAAVEGAESIQEMGGRAIGVGCDVDREAEVDGAVAGTRNHVGVVPGGVAAAGGTVGALATAG